MVLSLQMALVPLITLLLFRVVTSDRCTLSLRMWNASDAAAAEASEVASAAGAGAKAACCRMCPDNATCVGGNTCACAKGFSAGKKVCVPACHPPCSRKNFEKCVAPGRCECYDRYTRNASGVCKPVCKGGCGVGRECFAPDTCVCAHGYVEASESCIPTCSNRCFNARCVAPEICQCDAGFVKKPDSPHICEPQCGGHNCSGRGHCDAERNACACQEGYASPATEKGMFLCEPVCGVRGCGEGGKCVAPNTCRCSGGYKLTMGMQNGTCEPHCEGGCPHGACVAPDRCECNEGYERSDDNEGTCLPVGGPPTPPLPPAPTNTNTASTPSTEATSHATPVSVIPATTRNTSSSKPTTPVEKTTQTPSESSTFPSEEVDLPPTASSEKPETIVSAAASTGFLEWVRGESSTCGPRCAAVAAAVTSLVIASLVIPAVGAIVRLLRRRSQLRRGSAGEPLWL